MVASETSAASRPTPRNQPLEDSGANQRSDHAIALAARFLFEARRQRKIHFDEFSGTDGAFAILLGLFLERTDAQGVSAAQTIDFGDGPLSTAIYVLGVLVEGGWVRQIGAAGQERYVLSTRAESAMERYLASIADGIRNPTSHFD